MITGFNTDVKHKNRVFHIQTEDKGEANPCVESLVYVGGEILATKKTSYAEVAKEGRDDHAIQDLMEQQHRTMIAAIQRGRFDGPNGSIQIPEGMAPTVPEMSPPPKRPSRASSSAAVKAAKSGAPAAAVDEEKVDKNESTAPRGTPGTPGGTASDRSLDQMILDYLASDDVPEEVAVTLSPSPDFQAGRPVQTRLKAVSGSPPRPVSGAVVQVRILSTSARATTVFQGRTASDGSCPISFMIPANPNGTAAAVIRVTAPNASAEVQYPIKPK
ncbi:MAG TPA: hypothetical protein VGO79_09175 [Thermoanaerobaculia bacterium]